MDSKIEKLRSKQEQGTINPTGSVDIADTKANSLPAKESENNDPRTTLHRIVPTRTHLRAPTLRTKVNRKLKTRSGVLPEPFSRKREG
jgi:hypothetical protein